MKISNLLLRRRLMEAQNTYVTDGLLLWLDSNDYVQGQDWISRVGNYVYTANSNIPKIDNYLYFNGSEYMPVKEYTNTFPRAPFTVEVVFQEEQNTFILFTTGIISGALPPIFGVYQGTILPDFSGQYAVDYNITSNIAKTISLCPRDKCIQNKVSLRSFSRDNWYWSENSSVAIGKGGSNRRYKGKLWCIRLYNRYLTLDEILHNQEIDNIRFGLGF